MLNLFIISFITLALIVYGAFEYFRHQRNINKIPIRIHVNGTRGKSSVTRLIGAGLRAGGYSTVTKVTGTFPRMILTDGTEIGVHRKEKANILEQLKVVDYCAKQGIDVLLIECMALQPNYQRITEKQMIRATHGVITNIRLDHLDVMGPTIMDVAEALSGTVPKNSSLFSAEDRLVGFLQKKCDKQKTQLVISDKKTVSKNELEGFTYFEHAENVALALAITDSLNIDRSLALDAMYKTLPDEGALRKFNYRYGNYTMHFYNALAANDPESSAIIWNGVTEIEGEEKEYVVLFNSRKDRKNRSEEMIEFASKLSFNFLALTGENVELVKTMALKNGIPKDKIILIGEKEPEEQLNELVSELSKDSVVVAMGNMGAGGAELSSHIENHHK